MAEAEYVSQAEAARQAHVSRGTIQRWIREGELKVYKRAGMQSPLVQLSVVLELARIVPKEDDTNDGRRVSDS